MAAPGEPLACLGIRQKLSIFGLAARFTATAVLWPPSLRARLTDAALPGLALEWYKCSFGRGRISPGGRSHLLAERITYSLALSAVGAPS